MVALRTLLDTTFSGSPVIVKHYGVEIEVEALTDGFVWTFTLHGPGIEMGTRGLPPEFPSRADALAAGVQVAIAAMEALFSQVRPLLDAADAGRRVDFATHGPVGDMAKTLIEGILSNPEAVTAMDPAEVARLREALRQD